MASNVLTAIRQRGEKLAIGSSLQERTAEWFPEQRAFYEDPSRLVAALCGRRAGKTRGGCLAMLLAAATTVNGRFLYINETRAECMKLAWYGLRGDGMYSLAMKLGLACRFNSTNLSIHFPDIDSWIYLLGADDDAGVRKALGLAYNEIWWDEAQKIPDKLEPTIRSVLMPTLLDYSGRLRLTGTPVRNMTGLFYGVTRTDGEASKGWSVHRWNLLHNPFFGRHELASDGTYRVIGKSGRPLPESYATENEVRAAVHAERYRSGVLELQESFGGADAAPVDAPLMQREAFGQWVHEDALYVYAVHRVPRDTLTFAPARYAPLVLRVPRMDGDQISHDDVGFPRFPDIEASLADLPGWPERDYLFCLGADIGYQDPFAFCLGAWSGRDPVLYEVAAWGEQHLDQPIQAAILRYLCDKVGVGFVVADGGGSVLPTVKGWSREWVGRYGVPIDEAEKTNKAGAIERLNGELVRGQFRLRVGGQLLEQMERLQWQVVRSDGGRLIENPRQRNDVADAALYMSRRSFPHRYQPEPVKPKYGTEEYYKELEEKLFHATQEADSIWH
jgi:hypothetical protein